MKNLFLVIAFMFSVLAQAQNIDLIYHWEDETLPASQAFANVYNEIWGFVQDGKEYAVIGSTDGTHFFDLSDTDNIQQVAFVPGAVQGPIIIHRDYHDHNGFLYCVADEGTASTLQVIDLSGLPASVEVVYDSNELFTRAHNIFIDTATAILYTISQKNPSLDMGLYDISNPSQPTFLNSYDTTSPHDAYVLDGICYFNDGTNGFKILDCTDPMDIKILGSLENYEAFGQGYNHSGWLTDDGLTYAMCDETNGVPIKLVDVSDFDDIEVASVLEMQAAESMVHNVMIRGDYLFCSHYHEGLVIYDISDANNPERVAEFDTFNANESETYVSFQGAWGIYSGLPSGKILISDMQTGLYVFETDLFEMDAVGLEDDLTENLLYSVGNSVYLEMNDQQGEPGSWMLTDLAGKQWASGEIDLFTGLNEIAIPSELASGIYIFQIELADRSQSLKLNRH